MKETSKVTCPQCGLEQSDRFLECMSCGQEFPGAAARTQTVCRCEADTAANADRTFCYRCKLPMAQAPADYELLAATVESEGDSVWSSRPAKWIAARIRLLGQKHVSRPVCKLGQTKDASLCTKDPCCLDPVPTADTHPCANNRMLYGKCEVCGKEAVHVFQAGVRVTKEEREK